LLHLLFCKVICLVYRIYVCVNCLLLPK